MVEKSADQTQLHGEGSARPRRTAGVVSLFLSRPGVGRQLGLREIPLSSVIPRKDQPRKYFSEASIMELAASIAERGLKQPVGVRPLPDGKYELIWGERRFRAITSLNWETIPAIVTEGLSEQDVIIDSLLENILREDLSAIETAMAFRTILERAEALGQPMTYDELGKKMGMSKSRVSQMLNIFNLPDDLLAEFCSARLEMNEIHSRALMMLKKFPEAQQLLFGEIKGRSLSGQQATERANALLQRLRPDTVTQTLDKQRSQLKRLRRKAVKASPEVRTRYQRELRTLMDELQQLLDALR